MTADRAGRENGAASPVATDSGTPSCAASRYATTPRPARGACPAVIAATAGSHPARTAGTAAATPASASMPSGTVRLIHSGTNTRSPWTGYRSITGSTHQFPSTVPTTAPAAAGMLTWAR